MLLSLIIWVKCDFFDKLLFKRHGKGLSPSVGPVLQPSPQLLLPWDLQSIPSYSGFRSESYHTAGKGREHEAGKQYLTFLNQIVQYMHV